MIRISLPWMIEVMRAVDGLSAVTTGKTYGQAWPDAYNAKNRVETLFTQSLYRESLRSSRASADELFETLTEILNANVTETVSDIHAWKLGQQKSKFQTVFLAEIGTLPSYYVLPKAQYDVNTLLEFGETLMPADLATKVPEAVFDAKESGKALAFELGTACGFHAFRALESVVRRYLKEVAGGAAEPKQRNLGVYIRALEGAQANERIIAALRQLKDLHRNPLVHPQVAIPTEEAISILGMVRSVVAAMLNELPEVPQTTTTAAH